MADKHAKLGITTTKICCTGAGYVGGPTLATIAIKCTHITVTIVDMNEAKIAAWNDPDTDEPGLVDVVKVCRGRNLFFSTDVAKGIQDADIKFASVNTPTKKSGNGAGRAVHRERGQDDCTAIDQQQDCDREIDCASSYRSCSQTRRPAPGTIGKRFWILSNPEFLAEGSVMKDLDGLVVPKLPKRDASTRQHLRELVPRERFSPETCGFGAFQTCLRTRSLHSG